MPTLKLKTDYSGKPVVNLYIGIGLAKLELLRERGLPIPTARSIRALVDTGASRTVIEEDHLKNLGLSPVGEEDVHTASSGTNPVKFNVYSVDLSLAEEVTGTIVQNLAVLATGDLSGLDVQLLLGRDVLSRVVLTYFGPNREFSLEFVETIHDH